MKTASDAGSGKGHRNENFPVASRFIARRHRPTILSFYRFARAADDVADHPTLGADEKFALLDSLEATLLGRGDAEKEAIPLRAALAERGLSPRHALDLLTAFRLDVTQRRYRDWAELVSYCRHSAMPVGRFVLDVHGESEDIWPLNDALCTALQIINHLQDCGRDYRSLDRVYLPLDALAEAGAEVEALGEPRASPALRRCLQRLAHRTDTLLDRSAPFSASIADFRLRLEVAAIQRLARALSRRLMRRDPLSERVHLSKFEVIGNVAIGLVQGILRRPGAAVSGGAREAA
jgi:hydroxysqualene synthase